MLYDGAEDVTFDSVQLFMDALTGDVDAGRQIAVPSMRQSPQLSWARSYQAISTVEASCAEQFIGDLINFNMRDMQAQTMRAPSVLELEMFWPSSTLGRST